MKLQIYILFSLLASFTNDFNYFETEEENF